MFGPLGVPELIFIFVLALLIFGPRRLPEIGRTMGKAMGEFRRATTELKRSINTEIALEEEDERPKRPPRREVEARVSESGLLEPAGAVAHDASPDDGDAAGATGEPGVVSGAETAGPAADEAAAGEAAADEEKVVAADPPG